MSRTDARAAARLLQYALVPTNRPREGSEYRNLFDRYRTDSGFAELVQGVAEGLGLYVRTPSPQLGLILAGDPDGPFRVTLDNAGLPIRSSNRLQDRRAFGLVLTAIAAYAFPNGEALTETSTPTVRPAEVERYLTRRIETILGVADSGGFGSEDEFDAQLGEAARLWLELPEVLPNERGGLRRDCRRWYVVAALDFLVGSSRARKEQALSDDRGDAYALNDRFRIGLAETAETAVFELLARADQENGAGDGTGHDGDLGTGAEGLVDDPPPGAAGVDGAGIRDGEPGEDDRRDGLATEED